MSQMLWSLICDKNAVVIGKKKDLSYFVKGQMVIMAGRIGQSNSVTGSTVACSHLFIGSDLKKKPTSNLVDYIYI